MSGYRITPTGGREWDGPVVAAVVERIEGYPYHITVKFGIQTNTVTAIIHVNHTFSGNETDGFTVRDPPEHHTQGFPMHVVAVFHEWGIQRVQLHWYAQGGVVPKRHDFDFHDWLANAQMMADWFVASPAYFPSDERIKQLAAAQQARIQANQKLSWGNRKQRWQEREAEMEKQRQREYEGEIKRRANTLDGYDFTSS